MDTDIWKVIVNIGIDFHPDLVDTIANKIMDLSSVEEFYKVSTDSESFLNKGMMNALLKAWEKDPQITPLEITSALRSASRAASIMQKRESIEMVWTGPNTGLVPSRHTEQVLHEVIDSASLRLFIVWYVAYDIDSVKKSLQDAVDRDVKVDVLLESSKDHGGKINTDFRKAFKKALPDANFFAWNSETKSSNRWNGVVHAKCAVADGSLAFITSANLTRAAMENNMELGVLIRGGSLPKKLDRHLQALVTTGVIEKT